MGYYTCKFISCTLRPDTPTGILDTIKDLCNGENNRAGYVDDETYRVFESALSGNDCAYPTHKELKQDKIFGWVLFFNGSSKNYNGEFEKFLEWIKPFIESGLGVDDLYAFSIGEGDNFPAVYKLSNGNQY